MVACGAGHRGEGELQPFVLTVGSPLSDTVELSGFNAYAATVSPGALYKISITNQVDDTDLLVFGTDSSFTTLIQCAIDNTSIIGTSAEDCIMVATGNTLYFGVDGTFLSGGAATYTIDIELLTMTNTAISTPFPGSTTQTGAVVSAVTVSPGVTYTTSITGLTDNVDLYMFGNDNTFSTPAICSPNNTLNTGTTPEDCTLVSSGGTLFFIVDGIFSSTATIQFTVLTAPTPIIPAPSDEGTIGSPIALTVNSPIPGQVAWGGTSFYTVSGLSAGTRYTISITGLTENANLKVFGSDSTFTTPASCSTDNTFLRGTTPEDCTLIASGSALYFSVAADTTSAGVAYINLVEPGP
jgi:hypothetical protein